MDKSSLIKLTGIPDPFGVLLLVFSFILFLAPYFSGSDFGLFKIPASLGEKRWLKVAGPITFGLCVFSFIPIFSVKSPSGVPQQSLNPTGSSSNSPSPSPTLTAASSTLASSVQSPAATSNTTETGQSIIGTFIQSINASVAGLRFYESPTGLVNNDQKAYQTRFPKAQTKFICWKLDLKHPPPGARKEFKIYDTLYLPDRSLLMANEYHTHIEPTENESWYSRCMGNLNGSTYSQVGTYTVNLLIQDTESVKGSFEIY